MVCCWFSRQSPQLLQCFFLSINPNRRQSLLTMPSNSFRLAVLLNGTHSDKRPWHRVYFWVATLTELAKNKEIQSLSPPRFYSALLMLRSLAFISCYLKSQKYMQHPSVSGGWMYTQLQELAYVRFLSHFALTFKLFKTYLFISCGQWCRKHQVILKVR